MSVLDLVVPELEYLSNTLASVLDLEITIVDSSLKRLVGTGRLSAGVGKPAPRGSAFSQCMETGRHLLIAGYLFGLGYGILQPLFQSFVTGTTEPPFRGAANATYMLSYDIGIGLGALLTGFLSEQIGIARSFAVTAAAFPVGALVYALYCDRYYRIRKDLYDEAEKEAPAASGN